MKKAPEYLDIALGGNINIATLKLKAWHEIMTDFANHCLTEQDQEIKDLIDEMIGLLPEETKKIIVRDGLNSEVGEALKQIIDAFVEFLIELKNKL